MRLINFLRKWHAGRSVHQKIAPDGKISLKSLWGAAAPVGQRIEERCTAICDHAERPGYWREQGGRVLGSRDGQIIDLHAGADTRDAEGDEQGVNCQESHVGLMKLGSGLKHFSQTEVGKRVLNQG